MTPLKVIEHIQALNLTSYTNYNILDLVPNWPGSTHDAQVLSQGGLTGLFEQNDVRPGCHLLGNSGYPFKPLTEDLKENSSSIITGTVLDRTVDKIPILFNDS